MIDKIAFQINGGKLICRRNGVGTTGWLSEKNNFKVLHYFTIQENFQFNKDLNISYFPKQYKKKT